MSEARFVRIALRLFLAAVPLAAAGCSSEGGSEGLSGSLVGKNVLVTLLDACAASHLSCYGYPRETTPVIDGLAAEGVLFEDVTAAAPYTLASVASVMTGEHPDVHQVLQAGDVLPRGIRLLAEAFDEAGYLTHGISTNAHVHARFGFDRGFDELHHFRPALDDGAPHAVPEAMLAQIRDFLGREHERPFFAYWHFMPPHAPYVPPPPYGQSFANGFGGAQLGSMEHLRPLTDGARVAESAERDAIVGLYDSMLRYVDDRLGEVRVALERAGLDRETLWIVVSDHGEAFGEHGLFQHSRTVYEEMLRVPLVLRFPERRLAGARIAAPVSLVDLFPTLVELCGLDAPPRAGGRSLVELLEGRELTERPILSRTAGPGPYTSLRLGRLKLIHNSQAQTYELYDLEQDPGETRDLSRQRTELLRSAVERLDAWRARARSQRKRV